MKAFVALLQEQGLSLWHHSSLPRSSSDGDHLGSETPSLVGNNCNLPAAASNGPSELPSGSPKSLSQEQSLENKLPTEKQLILNVSSEQENAVQGRQSKQTQAKDKVASDETPLTPPKSASLVSGNAFFICDGQPMHHFEYFRPWFEGLGYDFPRWIMPMWLMLVLAHLQEIIYCLVYKLFPFTPFVTPTEARKCGVTNYFSCRKAQATFGYCPTRPNDQTQVVQYLRDKGFCKDKTSLVGTSVKFALAAIVIGFFVYLFNATFV